MVFRVFGHVHRVYCTECQASSVVGIGTPPPPSPSPLVPWGGGDTLACGRGGGRSQFGRGTDTATQGIIPVWPSSSYLCVGLESHNNFFSPFCVVRIQHLNIAAFDALQLFILFWFFCFSTYQFFHLCSFLLQLFIKMHLCAADFALLNLPKGKSLGRSKPATSSYAQALQHTVWDDSYYIQALLNCLL